MQTEKPGSLAERFGDFGAAPSDQLWNSIASSLDGERQKKRGVFWWWFSGIAAGLLLLTGVFQMGYFVGKGEHADALLESPVRGNYPARQNTLVAIHSKETVQTGQNGIMTPEGLGNVLNTTEPAAISYSHGEAVEKMTPREPYLSTDQPLVFESGQAGFGHAVENTNPMLLPAMRTVTIPSEKTDRMTLSPDHLVVEKSKRGRWEFGFAVNSYSALRGVDQDLVSATDSSMTLSYDNLDTENSITGSGLLSSTSSNEASATVRRPLSLECTLARQIGNRWSLATGIGLNVLSSKNTTYSPVSTQSNSRYWTLSLPLVVDYDFVKRRRMDFSVGVGVMNEFPVFSHAQVLYPANPENKVVSKVFSRGYMGSALCRLNWSYALNERLKLNVSPGMRYYFYQSLQSDLPVLKRNLWGGASLGITWNI